MSADDPKDVLNTVVLVTQHMCIPSCTIFVALQFGIRGWYKHIFTWGSICLAYIRFRNAWKFHGHTLDGIPFKAVGGVYGPWLGLSLFFVAIAPQKGGINDAESFFQTYLALPVVLFFWVCGFLWKRAGWLRTEQIDVDSGRREIDWEPIHAERERLAAMPAWRRLLNIIF
ncbi:hypothetical protein BDV33DRAFT_200424 [Aspergillus novoparasiticus]|uniref:Amino acid permease/ SLC12A domain-containing protein n=1 Tax=Aspergillus novoparasiticus TaxID=986946 RepID=A0A5N6F2N4_9EURO|nr:hypothetical protein BDV33DRAFT_200424 [Aspergillus novoparasiticus]